jgi:Tfp pilus assembly protein PilZ
MSGTQVALVCRVEDRDVYAAELEKSGATVKSFGDLESFLSGDASFEIQGLAVDYRTLFDAPTTVRLALSQIEPRMPVLRLRRNGETGQVIGADVSNGRVGENALRFFIKERCANSKPSRVRRGYRIVAPLNLRVKNSKTDLPLNAYDISHGGVYVLCSDTPFVVGETVTVTLHDAPNKPSVDALVKWVLPWGQTFKRAAGFGIEFSDTSSEASRFLEAVLKGL